MRVNFIMPGLGDSGGIQVVRKYTEMMNYDGVDAIIYCPIKAYNLHRYNSKIKNAIHQMYCTIKTVITVLKNDKPEVKWVWSVNNKSIRKAEATVATMWATAYDVAKLSNTKGKKYYFVQDIEIWDNSELGLKSYSLPLEKIVISTWINNGLKEKLNIGPFPVLMNGIDIEKFCNNGNIHRDDVITFLMLNHTMEKKGVKQGLEVFEKVKERHSNVKLRMFGMCSNNNLPSYVEYIQNPSVEQLVNLYSTSDVFIFPSLEEGWGLTPLEAMACGCVVAGTRTGFVLDLGIHGKNMMISKPGDVDEMVNNIEQLINEDRYKTFINESRKVTLGLDWKEACKKFIEYLG